MGTRSPLVIGLHHGANSRGEGRHGHTDEDGDCSRTKLLFATAYDGEWDPYIDDFATKIPEYLDIISSAFEGWPGIRSPEAKDYIAKHQITAEGWHVANPELTVAEARRLMRIGAAVDQFLDKVGD